MLADTPVNRELYGPHAFYVPLPITEAAIAAAMRASMHDDAPARRDPRRRRLDHEPRTRGRGTPIGSSRR